MCVCVGHRRMDRNGRVNATQKRPQDIRQSSMFSTLFQAAPGWQIEMNFNNAAPHAYHIDLARWYTDYFYKNGTYLLS